MARARTSRARHARAAHQTHIEYLDQIEHFLADTDASLVRLCLDTGHQAYRGVDPVALMRKHYRRIRYIHIKSVDRQIQADVESRKIPFVKAVAMGIFCERSRGAVDFEEFTQVLRDVNYEGWAIVAQDMFPAPFDKPLPIAKRTRAYLREIGLG